MEPEVLYGWLATDAQVPETQVNSRLVLSLENG